MSTTWNILEYSQKDSSFPLSNFGSLKTTYPTQLSLPDPRNEHFIQFLIKIFIQFSFPSVILVVLQNIWNICIYIYIYIVNIFLINIFWEAYIYKYSSGHMKHRTKG
jgi:hypothetical protein